MADRLATVDADTLRLWQARRVLAWGRVLVAGTIVGMVLVLARVVQLKVAPDPRLAQAAGISASSRHEPTRRGDLLDRRGRVVATTTEGHRLFVDPQSIEDPNTIAVDVARALHVDPVPIDRRIQERLDSRYVVVHHLLDDWQVDAIRRADLRGVVLESRPVRHYPYGELASRLVGTVGFEHTGLSGLEHRFDEQMRDAPGELTFVRDIGRRALWIGPDGYRPGRPGGDVRLSIDLVIQDIAARHLEVGARECNAGGGRIVVLDPRTGELLALYDLIRDRPGWDEPIVDTARDRDPALGRNRGVTDPYEPGSTFKPFVWAIATDQGHASPDETLPTPEAVPHRTSYGRRIRDTTYYGDSTWHEVLVRSQNSGMAIVAERMSDRAMQAGIAAFGFGERSGCGLPGESRGLVTAPEAWTNYSQSSVAMGHEIGVTPVQMVRAFSAFARDGTIPRLRLTRAAADAGEDFRFVRRAVSRAMARTVRDVLRDVVTDGTGRRARSDRYALFGKSGTAQLPKADGSGYHEDRYVANFIAGAPYADPRVVVLCVIDDPDKSIAHYGGAVAGPIVRDVIDETLQYLGVPARSAADTPP